jgi:hypothetical protein
MPNKGKSFRITKREQRRQSNSGLLGPVTPGNEGATVLKKLGDLRPVDAPIDRDGVATGAQLGTKVELTILISRLMEGEDAEALRREYDSELLEEAISVLESRI